MATHFTTRCPPQSERHHLQRLLCLKLLRVPRSGQGTQPCPSPFEPLSAVAATGPSEPVGEAVASSQLSESRVLGKLLQLARDIRRPRTYAGYSAFLCVCLSRGCRAYFWEGDNRVDVLQVHAPWAIERCTRICAAEGVRGCLVHADDGAAVAAMMPVSETPPLSMCSHFVAAVRMDGVSHEGGPCLQGYYSSIWGRCSWYCHGWGLWHWRCLPDVGVATNACSACRLARGHQRLFARTLEDAMDARNHGALQEVEPDDVRELLRTVADVPIAVASGGQSKTPHRTLQRHQQLQPQSRWQTPQSRWQTPQSR